MKFLDKLNSIAMASGSLSTCSSLVMAIMISRSHGGLSTPYRRIIFGLSISDIIQSISVILGPFLVPNDEVNDSTAAESSWAIGNVHTCDFQGFIQTFGAAATCMYTLFLCLYYYCKLKRNMNDATFTKKIEKKMHCLIVLFNLAVCLSALATKTFNQLPGGAGSCQIMRKPENCDPKVSGSCERGHFAFSFGLFYFPVGVPCLCILGTLVFMFSVVLHVMKRDRLFRHDRTSSKGNSAVEGVEGEQESEGDHVARLLRREVTLQVVLYALAFLLTYGWVVVLSFSRRANDSTPSVFMAIVIAVCFPLMGLLNILIYTRPQVVAYRRLHRDVSWLIAFWRVLKAGGENPDSCQTSPRSRYGRRPCSFFKPKEKECEDGKFLSGMLRFMALYKREESSTPDSFDPRKQMRRVIASPCSAGRGSNSMENRICIIDSNHVECSYCENEESWNEEDGIRSNSPTIVKEINHLSTSQKDAISKAFEKASQRARTMKTKDHRARNKKLAVSLVSISERSENSNNRFNSDWSHGVSPGSLSGSLVEIVPGSDLSLEDFALEEDGGRDGDSRSKGEEEYDRTVVEQQDEEQEQKEER